MRALILVALTSANLVPACAGDETVAAYGAGDRTWTLQEIDGSPFPAKATLVFPERDRIAGTAPCNAYSAPMEVPYPWFETGPIVATKRACADLDHEQRFFEVLSRMTTSEVLGDVLILRDGAGREMLFKAND